MDQIKQEVENTDEYLGSSIHSHQYSSTQSLSSSNDHGNIFDNLLNHDNHISPNSSWSNNTHSLIISNISSTDDQGKTAKGKRANSSKKPSQNTQIAKAQSQKTIPKLKIKLSPKKAKVTKSTSNRNKAENEQLEKPAKKPKAVKTTAKKPAKKCEKKKVESKGAKKSKKAPTKQQSITSDTTEKPESPIQTKGILFD